MINCIESIDREHLCIGCGICESIAGTQNIKLVLGEDGFYHPIVIGSEKSYWAEIKQVCPGLSIHQPTKAMNENEKIWGTIKASNIGYSTDEQVRYISSSGGVISALLCFLLETKQVTGIVHVGKSDNDPRINEAGISRTKADIIRRAGSRYSPASPLVFIKKILDNKDERVAFVGRPCDVAALRSYLDLHSELEKQITHIFSFFCAGTPSQKGTLDVLAALGALQCALKDFRYRGHGWPGKTTAICMDGSLKVMNYSESWGSILNKYLHFRCKICPDGMGSLADITCGDAWHEKDGYPSFEEMPGQSFILARTSKGEKLLSEALEKGYLMVEPYDISALGRIQQYQQDRKKVIGSRILALRLAGKFYPRFSGFYLLYNGLKGGMKNNIQNMLGMLKRIRKLKYNANATI